MSQQRVQAIEALRRLRTTAAAIAEILELPLSTVSLWLKRPGAERIPLSLTLLYPWIPRDDATPTDIEQLRAFFAAHPPFSFDLVRVTEFPGIVAYAVPEPDGELRDLMRSLWALYPDYPPYGERSGDPPPHATLGRLEGEHAITLEQARARVEPLLPVRCEIREATLMEEDAPDRYRIRETFALGTPST